MWSVMFDFSNYMGLDGVYFEIWKRVAKQKVSILVCRTQMDFCLVTCIYLSKLVSDGLQRSLV
jgi:hypothetical protein